MADDAAQMADKLERGLAALYMSDGKNAAEAAATALIYLTAMAIPLLRRPEGWRPIDFMAVKQCSECSSQLCATARGMTGVIVVFDNREAAEAYQRAMLASTPAPPAPDDDRTKRAIIALRTPDASLARVPNTIRQSIADVVEELKQQRDRYGLALMMIREGCADPATFAGETLAKHGSEPSPPAHAELAGRLPTQAMYEAGAQAIFDSVYGGSSGLDEMLASVCLDHAKLAIDAAAALSPEAP